MTCKFENTKFSSIVTDILCRGGISSNSHLTDVTLVSSDNKQMNAHKIVMSAASETLGNILKDDNRDHSTVILADVDNEYLTILIEFIYLGQAKVQTKKLGTFLEVAKSLHLYGIDNLEDKIVEKSDLEGFCVKEEETIIHDDKISINVQANIFPDLEKEIKENHTIDNKEDIVNVKDNYRKKTRKENKYKKPMYSSTKTNDVIIKKRNKHKGMKYECGQCEYKSGYSNELKIHKEAKHLGIKYSCNHCDYITSLNKSLKRHIEYKHSDVRLSCTQCDYSTKFQSTLKTHIESKHEDVVYDCTDCDYQAPIKRALKQHQRIKHQGFRYTCGNCDFQATSSSYLKKHILSHNNTFKCDKCEYKTKFEKNLKSHKGNKHSNKTQKVDIQCDQCEYTSRTERHMNMHLERAHEDIPHPCTKCLFNANKAWILKEHLKLSHNE